MVNFGHFLTFMNISGHFSHFLDTKQMDHFATFNGTSHCALHSQ